MTVQAVVDLVEGHSRLVKLVIHHTFIGVVYRVSFSIPIDVPVSMALCRAFSEIFNVEKYRDLEIPVKGQGGTYHSIDWVRFAISVLA